MKKIELLAPAGSFEKAKIAFLYGADAIYCGTSSLSLRTRADMDNNNLADTIKYAHSLNKKVYVTLNIFAHDEKYDEIIEQVKMLAQIEPDGIIVADGGVMEVVKQYAPKIPVHMSTQSNIVSMHACDFWFKNGAKRMIILSGDKRESVAAVADALGISEFYAELLPEEKYARLEEILASGNGKVAYVGDGINDSPCIARADVGIAMGERGSDSAIEASDVVIMSDKLDRIPTAMRGASRTICIAKENIVFALGVKLLALALVSFNIVGMWMAVIADVGVAVLAILNSMRTLVRPSR